MEEIKLIDRLVGELKPVRPLPTVPLRTLRWWLLSVFSITAVVLLLGPLRSEWIEQILHSPRFALEVGLLVLISAVGSYSVLGASIPGYLRSNPYWGVSALTVSWIGLAILNVFYPESAHAIGEKRPLCVYEILFSGLCAGLFLLSLVRASHFRFEVSTGALIAISAGSIPTAFMHIGCIYEAKHILLFHLGPYILLMLLFATVGVMWVRKSLK